MEIIGIHSDGLLQERYACKIQIEDGILGIYTHGNSVYANLNQPKNNHEWNFREINWNESNPVDLVNDDPQRQLYKWKYSHIIEYETKSGDIQRIFINPSKWQIFYLYKNRRQLLIQKFTTIEYILASIITIAINILSSFAYDVIRACF